MGPVRAGEGKGIQYLIDVGPPGVMRKGRYYPQGIELASIFRLGDYYFNSDISAISRQKLGIEGLLIP